MADMEKHKRIINTLLFVMGGIYLIGAAVVAGIGMLATKNQLQADPNVALLPLAITGALIVIPLVLFGLFHIYTGRAFRQDVPWARIALWILAILNLGNVPLGTAFGAYAIWVLTETRESIKNVS